MGRNKSAKCASFFVTYMLVGCVWACNMSCCNQLKRDANGNAIVYIFLFFLVTMVVYRDEFKTQLILIWTCKVLFKNLVLR